jgi:hypothetical protein
MKKIPILLLVALTVGAAGSQTPPAYNGTFWNLIPSDSKVLWVKGFVDGYMQAAYALGAQKYASGAEGDKLIKPLTRSDGFTPSFGEIKDGMDEFYGNSQNLPICMHNAAYIEWRSMAGSPVPDKNVGYMRNFDGKHGCQ